MAQERVLVKHSVTGRMLVSSTEGVSYSFDQQGSLTLITLCGVSAGTGQAVERLKAELNVFRFEEPEDGPVIKHWYYVGDNPVSYDSSTGCLKITVQSEIEYRPDQYWE
ncbi:hypothetical protein [Paenibacillus riograndensis]|uniref:Uncharacterized protein n=1 Tax=Paenibacillus riograndensis SBR5 TaxID=1073571 RepID=A0A0E3WGI1_9BACL|nr:hypothetical protein [Paenibacillus riograndensis]CQR53053.1 hypothetical protein PRIO_1161 [Paenibacillus riograndensis SBR5]